MGTNQNYINRKASEIIRAAKGADEDYITRRLSDIAYAANIADAWRVRRGLEALLFGMTAREVIEAYLEAHGRKKDEQDAAGVAAAAEALAALFENDADEAPMEITPDDVVDGVDGPPAVPHQVVINDWLATYGLEAEPAAILLVDLLTRTLTVQSHLIEDFDAANADAATAIAFEALRAELVDCLEANGLEAEPAAINNLCAALWMATLKWLRGSTDPAEHMRGMIDELLDDDDEAENGDD